MIYPHPGTPGSPILFRDRYEGFIGGKWIPPIRGEYFDNISPVTGHAYCQVARCRAADVEVALEAAHAARAGWSRTSATDRADVLLRMADRIEENLEHLAVIDSWENGKPVRETMASDLPLTVDYLRYFAGAVRAQSGSNTTIDGNTVAHRFPAPLGVVGQVVSRNLPILGAVGKLAPALAAGTCVVLQPAPETPTSILLVAELVADLIPDGVLNVVTGFADEAAEPLAASPSVALMDFPGELGGRSPAIFLADVLDEDDDFLDKAIEGFLMFALNQGEGCTSPSRALIQESIYDAFIARCLDRVAQIRTGDPLDQNVMLGAQASAELLAKALLSIDIGRAEGAEILAGGRRRTVPGLEDGFYVEPTVLRAESWMRVFREEIFGPVVAVTTFAHEAEAVRIAGDALDGLGASVWARDGNAGYRVGQALDAGQVWINCVPSSLDPRAHPMMLSDYQRTKSLLVSHSPTALGLF